MGCGGSRLDNRADTLPAKLIRPLLWKRYDDTKIQKSLGLSKDSPNHSKKELLKDGVSDGDNSSQHHSPCDKDRGSISSHEDDVKVAPAPESDETTTENLKIAKAVESKPEFDKYQCEQVKDNPDEATATLPAGSLDVKSNETSTEIKEVEKPVAGPQELVSAAPDNNETRNKQDSKHGEDEEHKTLEAMAIAVKNVNEIEKDGDKDGQDSEQEDEEERRPSSMDESYICPASPSFRVYYIESLTTDDEEKDDDTDKKSSDGYSGEIIESVKSNELSGGIEKKKGKKGRRFRVIPKGKNLLKVKSCYYPSCSGGHDKARLLSH